METGGASVGASVSRRGLGRVLVLLLGLCLLAGCRGGGDVGGEHSPQPLPVEANSRALPDEVPSGSRFLGGSIRC